MSYMCEHYPTEDVAPRAAGYGIPYEIVDGQEIEVTYNATERAVEHARSGKGPYLVEFKTFRMALHFSGDPGGYVNPEDIEKWGKRDPIDLCQRELLDKGVLTPIEDQKLRDEVKREVEDAVDNAFASTDPTVDVLFEDLYAQKGVIY